MKTVPNTSEKAIPIVNFKQIDQLNKSGRIKECYKVNRDGTITFDRFEPYDNR